MVEHSGETSTALRSGESVRTKLLRIAEKARGEPSFKFTSLFHLMNYELLGDSFEKIRPDAAAGIDQVTKDMYAGNLEANLRELIGRLHRMAYIPQPVRRVYIPKPGTNKQRPLGIPTLEDKLVQSALARILEAVYEQDFINDSYGFRPARGCHDALRALSQTVEQGATNYIVEADIKGFYDKVEHDWLMKFLAHRIADKRVLRMVKRFLKAGVMEAGRLSASEEGVPQGGSISPILANVYLHYALDLWAEKVYRKNCRGRMRMIRYADDWVVCFQNKEDAQRFQSAVKERLGKFGLEIESSKTRMLEFGRYAATNARARGERPKTFDFLGFTHYCSRTKDGKRFRMKRVTAGKKFRAKLAQVKQWLDEVCTMPIKRIMEKFSAKLRGHYAYYGVTDNSIGIVRFARQATRLLLKRLNRRSQRRSLTWKQFQLLLKRNPLPRPRITVNLLRAM